MIFFIMFLNDFLKRCTAIYNRVIISIQFATISNTYYVTKKDIPCSFHFITTVSTNNCRHTIHLTQSQLPLEFNLPILPHFFDIWYRCIPKANFLYSFVYSHAQSTPWYICTCKSCMYLEYTIVRIVLLVLTLTRKILLATEYSY